MKNKYECLSLVSDEQSEESIPKVEKQWKCLKESILHANEEAAPKLERKSKKKWMNDQILTKMEERRKAKNTAIYTKLDKEIRKMCKVEKEKWYTSKCNEGTKKKKKREGIKCCSPSLFFFLI